MPGKQDLSELGNKFGRPDIERIGLFIEMPYLPVRGKPAKHRMKMKPPGRNMYCEGSKTKNGTQHGYFEDTFKRIFSKEALAGRGRKKEIPKFKNVSDRPFLPPIGFKLHSTPGDYYGTFSGVIESFGDKRSRKKPFKPELRNLFTSPGKLGGPGYTDICLNPYPEHSGDRYGLRPKYKEYGKNLGKAMVSAHYPDAYFDKNPFKEPENIKPGPTYVRPKDKPLRVIPPGHFVPTGPGKWKGGCQGGCFDKFPEHQTDRQKKKVVKQPEKVWYPPSWQQKSYYNTSVLHQNVDFRIHLKNHLTLQPTYLKYLAA